jgi:hypothetical protein
MRTKFILVILIISSFQLFGQQEKFFINDSLCDFQKVACWQLTYNAGSSEYKNSDLEIYNAEIISNQLVISISYGGGCGSVYLKLYVRNPINLVNEDKVELIPEFIDNDHCKAIRSRKVCFDLDPLLKGRKKPVYVKIGTYNLSIQTK